MLRRRARSLLIVTGLALGACSYDVRERAIPTPSRTDFAATAYPVLLRDCGFPACHGDHARFFQVFGPGRARLEADADPYAPASEAELTLSYERARSMLSSPDGPALAPLLRKPLAVTEGGAEHEGDDVWGQPIYQSADDPNLRILRDWALRGGAAPQ
jgi:hypothetical protein